MSDQRTLIIGTRGSALALWQAEHVAGRLAGAWPDLRVRLERIRTTGDKIVDVPLAAVGGKALFVKEIEEALLDGRVDVAVHSLKDLPAELPAGLILAATPEREDPSDVLISRAGAPLAGLRRGARVGTSSLRRQAQLLAHRPDLEIIGIRGNLDTRIRKLETEGLDAIVLARAGVKRLGLDRVITEVLPPDVLLPAVGQGVLGIETRDASCEPGAAGHQPGARRAGSDGPPLPAAAAAEMVAVLDHRETHLAMRAERAFLRRLGGGCQVPIAALARLEQATIHLVGLVAGVDGRAVVRGEARGRDGDPDAVGIALAEDLLERGGRAILGRIGGGEHRG
jgi:hydroxymethylbilane synthase